MSIKIAAFEKLAASVKDGRVGLLGYIAWFSLPDVRIKPDALANLAKVQGLSDTPEMGNKADAFRRATSPRSRRGENRTVRFLMRPVCESHGKLIRQLVVERVDTGAVKLSHVVVAEASFDYASGHMLWTETPELGYLDGPSVSEVSMIEQESLADFRDYCDSLTGSEIQRWVMRQLASMSHVSVHPNGGVYFVPAQRGVDVRKVQRLVNDLRAFAKDPADFPSMTIVPVLDDSEQRGMVKDGLVSSVNADAKTLMADLAELLARPSRPDKATVEHRMMQIGNTLGRITEYESLLETSMSDLRTSLDVVRLQAEALLRKASLDADPVVDAATAAGAKVEWSDTRKSARLWNPLNDRREVSVRFNDSGWSIIGATRLKIEDLGSRDEVTTHGDRWTAKTSDPEVAMLFIRRALRLQPELARV